MDSKLHRFNPLRNVLTFDDFDRGLNGWCELVGNYAGSLSNVPRIRSDMRPPQLSNATFFDIGTHGAMDGTYSMKVATRPRQGHFGVAIKRLTSRRAGLVQFEMYFAFTTEARIGADAYNFHGYDGNFHPSEREFGAFTVGTDLVSLDDEQRWQGRLRYVNADNAGELVQRWFYNTSVDPTTREIMEGRVLDPDPTDYQSRSPSDWLPVPGGEYSFCYNELPTKINWHYLRWQFDTNVRRNIELQVNDRIMDLRQLAVPTHDVHYKSLRSLLNLSVNVRANTNVRCFLYVDTAVISADW